MKNTICWMACFCFAVLGLAGLAAIMNGNLLVGTPLLFLGCCGLYVFQPDWEP